MRGPRLRYSLSDDHTVASCDQVRAATGLQQQAKTQEPAATWKIHRDGEGCLLCDPQDQGSARKRSYQFPRPRMLDRRAIRKQRALPDMAQGRESVCV